MQGKTLDVAEFFKQCEQIKNQRGTYYDGERPSYEIPLGMVSPKNRCLTSINPIMQKTARLVTLAEASQHSAVNIQAIDDTLKDLACYAALAWCELVKNSEKNPVSLSANDKKLNANNVSLKKNGGIVKTDDVIVAGDKLSD